MHAYWEQWDRDDLLSLQGVEIASVQDDEEDTTAPNILESESDQRDQAHYDPMYYYGLNWGMFL
jgi:hypothetical protein